MDRTELTRRFEVSIGNKQNFSSASVSENEEGRDGRLAKFNSQMDREASSSSKLSSAGKTSDASVRR